MRNFGALRVDCKCKMQNAECKIIGANADYILVSQSESYRVRSTYRIDRYIAP